MPDAIRENAADMFCPKCGVNTRFRRSHGWIARVRSQYKDGTYSHWYHAECVDWQTDGGPL